MNMRAAVVHLIGDIIQSVGVVIASIIIYFNEDWAIADPICTYIFTILVLFTTIPIFRDCIHVLMEASPKEIDVA
jgi:zinc transporter 2